MKKCSKGLRTKDLKLLLLGKAKMRCERRFEEVATEAVVEGMEWNWAEELNLFDSTVSGH